MNLYIPKFFVCETEGGKNNFYLTGEGKLFKCLQYEDDKKQIGTINKIGEVDINKKFTSEWANFNKKLNNQCNNCKFLPKCFGGCKLNLSNSLNSCFHEKNFKLKTLLSGYDSI